MVSELAMGIRDRILCKADVRLWISTYKKSVVHEFEDSQGSPQGFAIVWLRVMNLFEDDIRTWSWSLYLAHLDHSVAPSYYAWSLEMTNLTFVPLNIVLTVSVLHPGFQAFSVHSIHISPTHTWLYQPIWLWFFTLKTVFAFLLKPFSSFKCPHDFAQKMSFWMVSVNHSPILLPDSHFHHFHVLVSHLNDVPRFYFERKKYLVHNRIEDDSQHGLGYRWRAVPQRHILPDPQYRSSICMENLQCNRYRHPIQCDTLRTSFQPWTAGYSSLGVG